MARKAKRKSRRKPYPIPESRVLAKLEKIEHLLEDLLLLQGCLGGANRRRLAKWVGVDRKRVSQVSKFLKDGDQK